MTALVKVESLSKMYRGQLHGFPPKRETVRGLFDVSFDVEGGETFAVVGESGSGKSTLARCLTRVIKADLGSIVIDDQDVVTASARRLRAIRRQVQMVFQDPYSSLNPMMTVRSILSEPLHVHEVVRGRATDERLRTMMADVGLDVSGYLDRYPAEFSGGQRQRIAIARALAPNPRLVIFDEAVASLDVITQANVINLLMDLQRDRGLTYVFISHDLAVVRHIADHIAVMHLGRIVELGPARAFWTHPLHPYTQALLSASPAADPAVQRRRRRIVLKGDIPSPANPPTGCEFHTRCPYSMEICREVVPTRTSYSDPSHSVACHLHEHGPTLQGESVAVLVR